MSLGIALAATLFGALIGSFTNVVIGRLPEGRSIVRPGSSCPACGRRLGPAELVPILSWMVQGARCRGCDARISARYPLVEALVAAGFGALAWRWSPLDEPIAFLALATWWTLLIVATFIDLDTFEIPDVVTLPGSAALLIAAAAWGEVPGLPDLHGAATGAAIGAGLLTAINRLGALALRRFRDTRERLWPIGFDQANLAALAGALGGFAVGAVAAAASLATNLATRRTVRLPEGIVWLAWLGATALAPATIGLPASIGGGLAAAGLAAWVGAWTWWIHDLRTPANGADAASEGPPDGADEPVAMGFGDVKLAALLGAVLGWERLLVAIFAAVLVGAVIGLIQRAAGGTRVVPFGPFLALGGVLALFFGDALLRAYLGALGVA